MQVKVSQTFKEIYYVEENMKLGPYTHAKTQQQWRAILHRWPFANHPRVELQLSPRTTTLYRLQNHLLPTRSTRFNTNSFQHSILISANCEDFNSHITEWLPHSSGWWIGREERAWPSSFSYPHTFLLSGIQGLESHVSVFSPLLCSHIP